MIYLSDEPNAREEEILRSVRQYLEDYRVDTYNIGYDEGVDAGEAQAWDEARNKGYDEGWEDACQYILDTYLNKVGFVATPDSPKDLERMYEAQLPAAVCVAAVGNYLYDQIQKMKVDKDD